MVEPWSLLGWGRTGLGQLRNLRMIAKERLSSWPRNSQGAAGDRQLPCETRPRKRARSRNTNCHAWARLPTLPGLVSVYLSSRSRHLPTPHTRYSGSSSRTLEGSGLVSVSFPDGVSVGVLGTSVLALRASLPAMARAGLRRKARSPAVAARPGAPAGVGAPACRSSEGVWG